MAINFNNASVMSYDSESNFFGDNIIRYRTTQNIDIEGYVLDLTNQSGVSGIISGIQALEVSANDWQNIVINGVNLGSGVINSINFDTTNGVRQDNYRISLSIFNTGSINNLPTNDLYNGIDYTNYRYVESLSEEITFSRDYYKDTYNHTVGAKILSTNKSGSITLAKTIAENLFISQNILNCIGNYSNIGNNIKPIYSESYDQLNAECNFTKRIDFYRNSSGNYSISKNYTYLRDEEGIANVTESAEIIALVPDYLNTLTTAFNTELLTSYTNCLDVFNAYKESNTYPLDNQAIVKGNSINRFARTLNYEITYTNNLKNNNGYFWEYTHSSDLSDNGLISTDENGTIIGRGHRVEDKYNNAINGYNIVLPNIESRSFAAYDRFIDFINLPNPNNFYLIASSENHAKHRGIINYGRKYSNDSTLVNDPFINQCLVTVNEGFQVPITSSYNLFNYKEIEQISANFEVAIKSVNITLRGKRNTTISYYLNYAKTIANQYTANTNFITNVNYALNPFDNTFTLTVEWAKIIEP